MDAKEKKIEKQIKSMALNYDPAYLKIFTEWVSEFFVLATFPYFLFKEKDILNEIGCGACIRCILEFKRFESLEDISYNISIEKKTIFPATVLGEWVNASKEIFDEIKGELWDGDC